MQYIRSTLDLYFGRGWEELSNGPLLAAVGVDKAENGPSNIGRVILAERERVRYSRGKNGL